MKKKKIIKKFMKMDILEDLKMSLLNFNFVMIYLIHEMLVLLKNNLNYLSIFECFFKECKIRLFFFLKIIFFTTCNDEKFKPRRNKHN